jgi:N-acetylmuramate 1-kinase
MNPAPPMDTDGMDLGPALEHLYGTAAPADASLHKLAGDASTRTYYRLRVPLPASGAPGSAIIMRLPGDPFGSDEAAEAPRPHELPFLNVRRLLHERGVPVPAVLLDDLPRGLLVLEDLGDETFEARLGTSPRSRWAELYGRAVDLLAHMHECCGPPAPDSLAHGRHFGRDLIRSELDHFREWGLEAVHGQPPRAERAEVERAFDAMAEAVDQLPAGFVHRDYQSRNLMVRPTGDLVVIDFQDALQGPHCYDLVALLCDSYVTLDEALQDALLERYAERRGLDAGTLRDGFWLVAAQRKLKDAGRFVYIDRVRQNPGFLRWYGSSLIHVGRALQRLERTADAPPVGALGTILSRRIPGFPDAVASPSAAAHLEG